MTAAIPLPISANPGGVPSADAERLLESEKVVWLSTAGRRTTPGLVPVWFVWDGSAFLLFSKPNAHKVRNLRANPRVMLAVGSVEDDFDVQLVEGIAHVLREPTREVVPDALFHKYRKELRGLGLTRAGYAATYSQPIRVVPTRFLPWRGRSHLARGAEGTAARRRRLRLPRRIERVLALARRSGLTELPGWLTGSVQVGGTAWTPPRRVLEPSEAFYD